MAVNEQNIMTSHNLPNYSGLLFNKGNTATPFSTLIGGKYRTTNHWEFATSQSYQTPDAKAQPAITESQSLVAPTPTFVGREQDTNFCQIFQGTVQISYGKQSSMGQLSGLNIAGQQANPANELDFQVANKMQELRNSIEYTFLNGVKQKGTHDDVAYKTDGIASAIKSNVENAGGDALGYWMIAEMLKKIRTAHAPTEGLILLAPSTQILQINADATANGLTVIPAGRNINGLNITTIETPFGTIGLLADDYVADGTALFVNYGYCAPVHMPVPGKGNFFLEPLAKTGASDKYQIYGQLGLDYGAEWYHGKITGLSTAFKAPEYSRKVFVVNATSEAAEG